MIGKLTSALLFLAVWPNPAAAYYPGHFQALFQTFPLCEDGAVTSRIIEKFNWAEQHTWNRGIALTGIDRPHEHSSEWFGPSPVARRYCQGRAFLSDGRTHPIYYRIEGGMGLAGTGWKVEFCMTGHDPWRVHDGGCRVLRR